MIMWRRGLWAFGLGLISVICSGGCQSTGGSGDADSRAPAFGVDRVPRQSEPAVDAADIGRRVASREPEEEAESTEKESIGRKENLLSRLLPGRDKENPERKALPVSKRSARADGDSDSDDDDDFEF